jgi:Trk-type K+ transport system membrane component
MTHFIGGMGIVYITITFLRSLAINRSEVINAEAEGPHIVHYDDEKEAIGSGFAFFKVYVLLTVILVVLLALSGWYARITPYEMRYDSIFDAINYAFSTMGTG